MTPPQPASAAAPRMCLVIPFYNHPGSIGRLIDDLRPLAARERLHCYLVDDGSEESCEPVLKALARAETEWLRLLRYRPNQGKGMAVITGLQAAALDGYTHAAQIDADGQHRVTDLETLLRLSAATPEAMITGCPVYDSSIRKSRLYGRYLTHVWVWINTLSLQIRDSMCGLRVYPLAVTLDTWRRGSLLGLVGLGRRMSFDIEILVRLYWRGVGIVNVPVPVTYPADGVSHFRPWRDNMEISAAHARMLLGMLWRAPMLLVRNLNRCLERRSYRGDHAT